MYEMYKTSMDKALAKCDSAETSLNINEERHSL